jgi:hypothetical protein
MTIMNMARTGNMTAILNHIASDLGRLLFGAKTSGTLHMANGAGPDEWKEGTNTSYF